MDSTYAAAPLAVMLVDDNETDIFLHSIILEQANFAHEIMTHDNGRSALDYIEKHKENPSKLPHIIFLDLNMPFINGFKFLEEFEHFPEAVKLNSKIVILSSSDNKKDMDMASCNKYVIYYCLKPLSEDALATIKKLI